MDRLRRLIILLITQSDWTRPEPPPPALDPPPGVGDCYDHSMIEAFWSRMQVELLDRQRWKTRVEVANAIFEYLEIFHRTRRHSETRGTAEPPGAMAAQAPTGTVSGRQVLAALGFACAAGARGVTVASRGLHEIPQLIARSEHLHPTGSLHLRTSQR